MIVSSPTRAVSASLGSRSAIAYPATEAQPIPSNALVFDGQYVVFDGSYVVEGAQ